MLRLKKFFRLKWKYLFSGSVVYVERGSSFQCGSNVKIKNVKIHLSENSNFTIGDNVALCNTVFSVKKGQLHIGDYSLVGNGKMPIKQRITISNGFVKFGMFDRIQCERIWVRFGGQLNVGNYVFINDFSEIRCDEFIKIGDFNQISYNVKLWDTNTHEIESAEQRRKRWIEQGLLIDVVEKPKTKPVAIGDDCWIGDSAVILKGSCLGNRCIVGTKTIISGENVSEKTTVVYEICLKFIPNKV